MKHCIHGIIARRFYSIDTSYTIRFSDIVPFLNSDHGAIMLGHLVLPIPDDKDKTGEKNISTGEEVRVLGACPVLDRSVTSSDETCLDGDSYDSSDYLSAPF